jgi:hypothetical protein
MTLWIWETRPTADSHRILYARPDVVRLHGLSFLTGERPTRARWPRIELPMRRGERGTKTDALSAPGLNGEAFGPRLRALLADLGVTNLEYYPLRILDVKTGKTIDDYRVANILGHRDCIDSARSTLRRSRGTEGIRSIKGMTLVESKARGLKMFRLTGFLPILIVTEDVKLAVKEAGITGVEFYRPEGYCI